MKKILLTVCFFIFTLVLKAQTADSTEQSLVKEITTYQSKDLTFIANARLIIAEAIKANDLKKAKTTFRFIVDKYDLSNYVPFAWPERFMLSLALEEYGVLLTDISRGLNNLSTNRADKVVAYKSDGIFEIASAYVEKNKTTLQKNIPNAERLQQEDKDLLVLMYKSFEVENEQKNRGKAVELLNNDTDVFVQQYPESVYIPFVKRFIKEEYQEADTGLIMDFGINSFNLSSKFYQYFDKKDIGFAFGFNFPYKKWLFSLSANFMQGLMRTDMPLFVSGGHSWDKDIKGSIVDIEFGAGYNIISSKRFRIYPYATFAYNAIVPLKQENRDVSMYRGDGIAIGAGAIIDYKFIIGKPKEAPNPYNSNSRIITRTNFGIRLKGMYMIPSVPIKELSQPYSYFGAGLFWEIRRMNRK